MELAFNDSNITMTTENNQILEVDPFLMLLLILSPCCNLLLLAGIIWRKPICFIPWMVFYGLELFACWMSGFFLLFGKYIYLSVHIIGCESYSNQILSKIRNIFSSQFVICIVGDFVSPGMILLTRGALLTWIWVFGVRRHFKEVCQRI